MRKILLILTFFLVLIFPVHAFADSSEFITVVNPVRISRNTSDPVSSLMAEYSEVQKRNLSATWLLTYDSMQNSQMVSLIKQMDKNQELGLFFEVSEKYATDSGVKYNKTDDWFRATSVFLSGYTQDDRKRLINASFNRFKDIFGYYPKSVGAWWIDSYSLDYMTQRYGVIANLDCSDQYSTDGYQIWGQYWSTPYYPSKLHSGIPAQSLVNKINTVTIQWAPRDPLNGYGSGRESLYSTQDYFTINLKDDYFEKLVNLYAKKHSNRFGQITIGLESDLGEGTYSGVYARQLDIANKISQESGVQIGTMETFAKWYQQAFPGVSPSQIIESNDLLGQSKKSLWFQSPYYRIGVISDANSASIIDLRSYINNFEEPYYLFPNKDLDLKIEIPNLIDSANNPEEVWNISSSLKSVKKLDQGIELTLNNDRKIDLYDNKIVIDRPLQIPNSIINSPLINTSDLNGQLVVNLGGNLGFNPSGYTFRDLKPSALALLKQRKVELILLLLLIISAVILINTNPRVRVSYTLVLLLIIFVWIAQNSQLFFVSQSEIESLDRLRSLNGGNILVANSNCLQCSYEGKNPPAVFFNKRNYVSRFSEMPIIYDKGVLEAKDRQQGRDLVKKLDIKYIYLANYENYRESLPFSPGDYNLEKVYENANSSVWKVR